MTQTTSIHKHPSILLSCTNASGIQIQCKKKDHGMIDYGCYFYDECDVFISMYSYVSR